MTTTTSKRPIVAVGIVLFAAGLSAIGSDDPLLTLASGSVFALAMGLLWRFGEPPALLLAAGMQLCQVVTPLTYANLIGVPLQDVSLHIGDLTKATWLALVAMLALVLGMWCGQLRGKPLSIDTLRLEAVTWLPETAFRFCIVTLVVATGLDIVAAEFSGLTQVLTAASGIQWVGVFVLTCVCVARWQGFKYLILIAGLEVIKGFTGFFSDFKVVFLVLVVAIFSVQPKLKVVPVLGGLIIGGVLLTMGAFWSAIKTDYRLFLDQGSREQVVRASPEERVAYLMDRVAEVDWQTMGVGLQKLVKRVGYVDYLAAALRHVPARLEFQNGAGIGAAILHVLQPRLLFPDKPPLPSDTKVTAKYTGLAIDRGSQAANTSISIGYVGELYVDFGISGALIGTFILGLGFGYAFRVVCSSASLPVMLNAGLCVTLMLPVAQFEQALTKTIGAFLTTFIAVLLLARFVLPRLLEMFGPRPEAGIGQPIAV